MVGIVGTAAAQSLVAMVGFIIAGVPGVAVLTIATFFFSMVPVVGATLIWLGAACGLALSPVGQIVAGTGVVLVRERADGKLVEQPITYQGYDHFPDSGGGDDARRAR